eukprot:801319-Rhodomonas_salina.1
MHPAKVGWIHVGPASHLKRADHLVGWLSYWQFLSAFSYFCYPSQLLEPSCLGHCLLVSDYLVDLKSAFFSPSPDPLFLLRPCPPRALRAEPLRVSAPSPTAAW